jgi:hypothetical protein
VVNTTLVGFKPGKFWVVSSVKEPSSQEQVLALSSVASLCLDSPSPLSIVPRSAVHSSIKMNVFADAQDIVNMVEMASKLLVIGEPR